MLHLRNDPSLSRLISPMKRHIGRPANCGLFGSEQLPAALEMRRSKKCYRSRDPQAFMNGTGMRIARLVEEPDWRDVLPQIDNIFFATSAVQTFRDDQHRASFRARWLGKYLEHFTNSFFIARDEDGTIAGYLAGCLDNPVFTPLFNDLGVYRIFAPACAAFPCHLHLNVDARFRGRRVGTALMEAFAAHARDHYAPGLHVVTDWGSNVRFYERNGFRTLAATRWSGKEVLFMGRNLISRNEQCPCGSGKKFKHCHGAIVGRSSERDGTQGVKRSGMKGMKAPTVLYY